MISRGRPDRDATKYPAGLVEQIEQIWRQMQEDLTRLSSQSQHIIPSTSGHVINRDEPEVIIERIRQAVMGVREER